MKDSDLIKSCSITAKVVESSKWTPDLLIVGLVSLILIIVLAEPLHVMEPDHGKLKDIDKREDPWASNSAGCNEEEGKIVTIALPEFQNYIQFVTSHHHHLIYPASVASVTEAERNPESSSLSEIDQISVLFVESDEVRPVEFMFI